MRIHYYATTLGFFSIFCLILLCCTDENGSETRSTKGRRITRKHDEMSFQLEPPRYTPSSPYLWEQKRFGEIPIITKEYFRCNGSSLNPEKMIEKNGKLERVADCGGAEKHSLPLRHGEEFVYPILSALLNYLQAQTRKKVVITSGHRCPEHNRYVDQSKENLYSKHQIGAEVSFYVQGLEEFPEQIVQLLLNYYQNDPDPLYSTFQRYEKDDTNVSTQPWYNKEIFIKLFKINEGRNFDNRHPFPYIAIQVRYDPEFEERVFYSWEKAYKNYLRN